MKRIITLFIALIYLVMSTGFVVNSHYCMGKLSSIELGRPEIKKCICGMRINYAKKSKCCHSKTDVVKLADAHKLAPSVATVSYLFEADTRCFYAESISYNEVYVLDNYLKKLPPNLHEQDTYKRISVFRI
ncbi:MAG: hypothetical protein KGO00_05465 [Bacteroidetes bacterium]|jgi:hypothetical protein|nr:hypothetical protein [Bacteroidota bacterium]